jgi:ABC-2 type transport system permease protein
MRLVLVHARANLLQLARYPTFVVPTLLFPALLFAFFGLTQSVARANILMASFAAYAVLSVAFFQFGVGIASDRIDPWETFVRTLPAGACVRFAARVASALAFATASAAVVVGLALATTPARLSAPEWGRFAVVLLAGGIPLALLGIAVGYWVPPKGALAIANLLYLAFAYVGGLWTGPQRLPGSVEAVAPFVPTRQWGDVVWAAAAGRGWGGTHWIALAAYTLLFGCLAVAGYRRDEGERFK